MATKMQSETNYTEASENYTGKITTKANPIYISGSLRSHSPRGLREAEMKALFALSGIEVEDFDEIPNQYWPRMPEYSALREESPWWRVETCFGVVRIGWRKRVLNIDWEDTDVRAVVTEDDVTKTETMVHAWNYSNAVKYLTELHSIAHKLLQT